MEKSIILGGNEYKYKINFKMSYDFLKYRNRITKRLDFSSADKSIVEEIVKMQEKVQKAREEGKTSEEDLSFVNELSPEALKFLQDNSKTNLDIFSQEEIVEIVSVFTGVKEEDKIYEILDEEVAQVGYDELISKLMKAIAEVFTNAKDSSEQKVMNKMELEKTINN